MYQGKLVFSTVGDTGCWVILIIATGYNFKGVLGGCSVAFYRIIILLVPNIARDNEIAKKTMIHIFIMELIIICMLLGFVIGGNIMSGL